MSENAPGEQTPENTEDNTSTDEELSIDDYKKMVSELRKESAGRRVKNRDLEDNAKKWQEHLDSQKSELEKLMDQHQKSQADLAEMRREKMIGDVLRDLEIDPDLAGFITGDTDEEIKEKAQKLKDKLSKNEKPQKDPDLFPGRQGKPVGSGTAENLDTWFADMWKNSN